MKDYTQEEVLKSLLNIKKKSRKRELVDKRSYLISILAFKFKLTEYEIAHLTGFNRNTVHYNKNLPVRLHKDFQYMENVYSLAQKYPFDHSEIVIKEYNYYKI